MNVWQPDTTGTDEDQKQILKGLNLTIREGEAGEAQSGKINRRKKFRVNQWPTIHFIFQVHAVMGPNGTLAKDFRRKRKQQNSGCHSPLQTQCHTFLKLLISHSLVLSGSGKSTLAKVLIGDSAYEVQFSPFSSVESIGSNDRIFIYIYIHIYGYLMISIDI